MKKLFSAFLLIFSVCLVTNVSTVNAAKSQKAVVKPKVYISSIKDINSTITKGTNVILPKTVKAYMSNKTYKNVNVKWSTYKIDNKTPKKIYYKGTVSGYSKKVNFIVTIKAIDIKPVTIKSIDNLEVTINQKDAYNLPSEVSAVYSDGTKKNVEIKWSTETVDTSKAGTVSFQGTVEGFTGKVTLTLKINEVTNSDDNKPGDNTSGGTSGSGSTGNTMTDAQKQALVNASNKLANVVSLTSNPNEKNLIIEAKSIIDSKISNPNASTPSKAALQAQYNSLSDVEKADLTSLILNNMDMNSLLQVKDIFFAN